MWRWFPFRPYASTISCHKYHEHTCHSQHYCLHHHHPHNKYLLLGMWERFAFWPNASTISCLNYNSHTSHNHKHHIIISCLKYHYQQHHLQECENGLLFDPMLAQTDAVHNYCVYMWVLSYHHPNFGHHHHHILIMIISKVSINKWMRIILK